MIPSGSLFKRWLPAALVGIVWLAIVPSIPFAATRIIDADAQLSFANRYFDAADYLRAAAEYERFIFFFPDDPRNEAIRLKAARAYHLGGEHQKAISLCQNLIAAAPDTPLAAQASFLASDAYLKLNAPDLAALQLHNLIASTTDPNIADEARYRKAWIYLETADWPQARQSLEAVSRDHRAQYRVDQLLERLTPEPDISFKSPKLAGFLSIVPGAGQFYCGRYQDALVAFLLNGGLILAAYETFSKELYALGGVISFVEVGFYTGNIYGAVSDAHKYNREQARSFLRRLETNFRLGLAPSRSLNGIILAMSLAF